MKAAVMRGGELVVDEVADPHPGEGQLLVRTLACGICGSDLHALAHGDQLVALSDEAARTAGDGMPAPQMMDLAHDVVMGHEFAAEVIDLGPDLVGGGANHSVGDVVVCLPVTFGADGVHAVGYSNQYPGGYGELMVLNDLLCLDVPNGLEATPRRAHRTHGRGSARGEPVPHRNRPGRGGARSRARSGWRSSPPWPEQGPSRSSPPTSPPCAAPWR